MVAISSCKQNTIYTVQLNNGHLLSVVTLKDINVILNEGDSVVLQSTRLNTYIYGKYVGVLPENNSFIYDSVTYYSIYQTGVIISNKN